MPFFTVVIPLYNKESFITNTLKSVLAQTFTDFEVIVVNDCSTDNSLAIALSVKDDRIRFIEHEVNKGLSASRNTGIKEAKSDNIAFLDADDVWKPEFLSKMLMLTQNYPKAGIYSSRYEEVYPNSSIPIVGPSQHFDNGMGLINFYETNLKKPVFCSSCLCVKKQVFEDTGYYDESITFTEDVDLYIRAAYKYDVAYCNEVLASYMIYFENQMTNVGLKNKIIPDFDKYEHLAENRKDIKIYLDFHRYIMAKHYRLVRDTRNYKKMLRGISLSSLNYKQIILLYAPVFVLRLIKKVKAKLIKKGLNPTTY